MEWHEESRANNEFSLGVLEIIKFEKTEDIVVFGREKGILAGANVVMPNLSPISVRKKYELYDNKICMDAESAQNKKELEEKMEKISYKIVIDRGDIRKEFE